MPSETQYADDCDFYDEDDKYFKEQLLPKIKSTFEEWNLIVNETKTEYTNIEISPETENRGKESWRQSKILGSKLGSNEDILHRMNLGCIAFANFKKIWKNSKYIETNTKIRLYEALVVPVIMYNSGTWASTRQVLDKLDSLHRRHIKEIMKIKWPSRIGNKELYEKSNTVPLSERAKSARWKMLGKILRHSELNPAKASLIYANITINGKTIKGRRGKPRKNLYDTIKEDLKEVNLDFETAKDVAADPKIWENLKNDSKKLLRRSERIAEKAANN